MHIQFGGAAATVALLVWSTTLSAQAVSDATRQETVVRDALVRYHVGLEALHAGSDRAQVGAAADAPGGIRELRLADVVELALQKNLDIAVERLNPQAIDLQIAALKNQYLPIATSSIGQRNNYQLPRDQLQGGQRVSIAMTTYNTGLAQSMPKYGGNFSLVWNNSKQDSSSSFATFNPTFTTLLTASYTQPLLRGLFIDQTRQQLQITQINREIAEENLRATIAVTLANVRNAYWELVFARSAIDVAQRALALADKLVEDNKARVEVGTLAPIDVVQAEAEAASRRQVLAQAEATLQTAELTLKRLVVSGTDDPLWRQELRPVDLPSLEPVPTDIEGAVRRALERRTDLVDARKSLQGSDVVLRYFRNQTLPEADFVASYGGQGIGGTSIQRAGLGSSVITSVTPGGYLDALRLLTARDYPQWNLQLNLSYNLWGSPADAQFARARVQRNQSQVRLRALELQVAAEVTNAALLLQSNLKRVDAARAARELAERRLEAEQSKFEFGISTNFFVVQAQRDLRDAENTELRALADYQQSLVNYERAQEAPASGGVAGGESVTAAVGGRP